MDNGLLNNRQISIKSTCHIFGRLSDTYERNKYSIIDFNNLNVYKTELEHFVVVVAVPVIFSHSDGRRIFGGWMNPNIPYNDDKSPFECITDFLFKTGIPKEIILGYYHFNSDEKDVEIYVPENLLNSFERKSGIECLNPFDELDSFLLIITDKEMVLGFFMDNGYFDQTRILTSKNEDSLMWAKNLYENLKINEF